MPSLINRCELHQVWRLCRTAIWREAARGARNLNSGFVLTCCRSADDPFDMITLRVALFPIPQYAILSC